jgi:RNA polymerase sigma-70 factor, ECF subfamily
VSEPYDEIREITGLLRRWQDGDQQALDRLIPLVSRELRGLASRYLSREWSQQTFQPTALVNEAWIKLLGSHDVDWQSRAHFFGIAARIMRRILVDRARHEGRLKRGGDAARLTLEDTDPAAPMAPVHPVDAVALDRALTRLEALDAQQGRIVELRFFGGLTIQETAEVMRVSPGTIKRSWVVARAWLYRELTGDATSPPLAED